MRIVTRLPAVAIAVLLGSAAEGAVTVRAWLDPPRVSAGESADLAVEVRGTQSAAMPSVPVPDGVAVRYVGPATQLSIVNGQTSSSVTHHFTVTPSREGSFALGPITVQADGQTFQAGTPTLQVAAGAGAETGAAEGDQLRLELAVGLGSRTIVYLHERVPLTVTLRVGQVRVTDVQYPRVGGDGFALDQLGQPAQRQETRDGSTFQVVEFRTALTPLRTGSLIVGPATMSMAIVTQGARPRHGFFGGMVPTPRELTSQPLALEVLPLPEQGRPPDFSGAVGRFALEVRAAPVDVAAGGPVTLTYTLSGDGDLSSVTPPALAGDSTLRVYPSQAATAPPGGRPGSRVFEQVVIPQQPGTQRLPPVRFSWFDPEARSYRRAEQPPITLTVRPAPQANGPQIVGGPATTAAKPAESLGRDIVFIKDTPGSLAERGRRRWRSPLFWVAQVLPLLLWGAAVLVDRRRRRLGTDARYARFTRAGRAARTALADARASLGRGDAAEFHDRVAGAVRDYLTAKLVLPPGAVTPELVSERLREAGLADGIADQVHAFFAACEVARFAPAAAGAGDLGRTLERAEEIVRALERARGLARAAAAAAILLAVMAGAARAAEDTPQAMFFRGNGLYADGRYAEAAAEYERLLASGVESANTYFNLGNAYLKAGDVGHAILAYERARRLAPGDPDLRANLTFAREQSTPEEPPPWWVRGVFPLARSWSSDALLVGASAAWWALVALLIGRRFAAPGLRRPMARAALVAGAALLVFGASAAYRLATVDLRPTAVVVAPAEVPVRFEPSETGTVHFHVKPGTTLELLGERDGWMLVGRPDGRRGWLEAGAAASL